MTSFFYVVSTAYHTSVPALRKCMDTSKKSLLADSAATHAPPAFIRRERIASHRLFEWSKDMKVSRGEVWRVQWMWKTLEDLGLLQQLNRQYAAEHCHVAIKHLYSEVCVVWTWLQDADDSLGDLHTLHCSQCSPWACSAPRLPLVHPKRESA